MSSSSRESRWCSAPYVMSKMTSYQRRLQDIAYYWQCCNELEEMVLALIRQLKAKGLRPKFPLGKGVEGDHLLTPYNTGEWPGLRC